MLMLFVALHCVIKPTKQSSKGPESVNQGLHRLPRSSRVGFGSHFSSASLLKHAGTSTAMLLLGQLLLLYSPVHVYVSDPMLWPCLSLDTAGWGFLLEILSLLPVFSSLTSFLLYIMCHSTGFLSLTAHVWILV